MTITVRIFPTANRKIQGQEKMSVLCDVFEGVSTVFACSRGVFCTSILVWFEAPI